MFQNCLAYNPPGTDVTIITKILQEFFTERVERMKELERTKIETVIEPKENKIVSKKSSGWPKGRPRKSKNTKIESSMKKKWPEHMFTAKVRDKLSYWLGHLKIRSFLGHLGSNFEL